MKWRHHPVYSDYLISSCGDVRRNGKNLKQFTTTKGNYLQVNLSTLGVRRRVCTHILVLEAFRGFCPKGMECRHLDGNPKNNNLSNLEWGTREENVQDKIRHGTTPRGEKSARAKLTLSQAFEIYYAYLGGATMHEISATYKVKPSCIFSIVTRKSWPELNLPPAKRPSVAYSGLSKL